MIHDLNHPNVVKFDEWYETNNHLWLVVELCTGKIFYTNCSLDFLFCFHKRNEFLLLRCFYFCIM